MIDGTSVKKRLTIKLDSSSGYRCCRIPETQIDLPRSLYP